MKKKILTLLAMFLFLFASLNYVNSTVSGTSGGAWVTTITYPFNNTIYTTDYVTVNFTINETSMDNCTITIGNSTGDTNFTGTMKTITLTNDTCQINITEQLDTPINEQWNLTFYGYNTSSGNVTVGNTIFFKVDTMNPEVISVSYDRRNDTNNLNSNETLDYSQDHVEMTIAFKDNNTDEFACGVKIYQEYFYENNQTTYWLLSNILNSTTPTYFHQNTSNSSTHREYEVHIPADQIMTNGWTGRFNITPYCTDRASHTVNSWSNSFWGAANTIESGTWTPIALLTSNISTKNYLRNLTNNSITYMAVYDYWNHTFNVHQWNRSTNDAIEIGLNSSSEKDKGVSNHTTVYLYADTNDWELIRFNNTPLEPINVTLGYNLTNFTGTIYNWNLVPSYQTNITNFVVNTSDSCGLLIDWVAWFNSSATSCAGGCWDALFNEGFGVGNESMIPFGTAYWALTAASNVTMTVPTFLSQGVCG